MNSYSECLERTKADVYPFLSNNLCTTIDVCKGDIGGPLICPSQINGVPVNVLAGIASRGQGCKSNTFTASYFGIYSLIPHFLEFLGIELIPDSIGCGGMITKASGTINYTNDGSKYQNNLYCEWRIKPILLDSKV